MRRGCFDNRPPLRYHRDWRLGLSSLNSIHYSRRKVKCSGRRVASLDALPPGLIYSRTMSTLSSQKKGWRIMKLPSRTLISCLILASLLAATSCGMLGGCHAKLSGMVPGMSERMDMLECWLTIEFKKYPKNADLRDVKVVFSSIALFEDESFDWSYIAANDRIAQGMGKGYRPNDETQPDQDPPLKTKIKVKFPLRARPQLELDLTETISLEATLFWGGKKQGSISQPIEHVYYRTLEKE